MRCTLGLIVLAGGRYDTVAPKPSIPHRGLGAPASEGDGVPGGRTASVHCTWTGSPGATPPQAGAIATLWDPQLPRRPRNVPRARPLRASATYSGAEHAGCHRGRVFFNHIEPPRTVAAAAQRCHHRAPPPRPSMAHPHAGRPGRTPIPPTPPPPARTGGGCGCIHTAAGSSVVTHRPRLPRQHCRQDRQHDRHGRRRPAHPPCLSAAPSAARSAQTAARLPLNLDTVQYPRGVPHGGRRASARQCRAAATAARAACARVTRRPWMLYSLNRLSVRRVCVPARRHQPCRRQTPPTAPAINPPCASHGRLRRRWRRE